MVCSCQSRLQGPGTAWEGGALGLDRGRRFGLPPCIQMPVAGACGVVVAGYGGQRLLVSRTGLAPLVMWAADVPVPRSSRKSGGFALRYR